MPGESKRNGYSIELSAAMALLSAFACGIYAHKLIVAPHSFDLSDRLEAWLLPLVWGFIAIMWTSRAFKSARNLYR